MSNCIQTTASINKYKRMPAAMRYAIKKDLRNEREHHHTSTKGHVNEKAAAATHTAQTETTLRTSTRYTIKQHTRQLQHAHTHTHTHVHTLRRFTYECAAVAK